MLIHACTCAPSGDPAGHRRGEVAGVQLRRGHGRPFLVPLTLQGAVPGRAPWPDPDQLAHQGAADQPACPHYGLGLVRV